METTLNYRKENLTILQQLIIKQLSTGMITTRKNITKNLNKPFTTIYDNLKILEEKKIIWRCPYPTNKRGRPSIIWQLKQAHGLVIFTKKKKKQTNDTLKKYGEIPEWAKEALLEDVKSWTYYLEELEEELKSKRMSNISYILNNQNSKLMKFILDKVNSSTFIKTPLLSRCYVDEILKPDNDEDKFKFRRSTSIKIGRIMAELYKLEIIKIFSNGKRNVWKNLYKNKLYEVLDEKMKHYNYNIKLKQEKK
jgi:hypothetical protein